MTHTGPILEGRGATDYERYIRTEELLELQKSPEDLINPDEMLFQTTHQAAELWLRLVDYEIERARAMISERQIHQAADLLTREAWILDLLRKQIEILETMAPADYHVIRTSSLGRGSGQESPGFGRLLDVGERVWPQVEALLESRGVRPIDVEREPAVHYDLHRLIQALLQYDENFMKWRYTHMKLAMRVIGSRVVSLKNVPVSQLENGTREPLFPALWEMISDLTEEIRPVY
ncbi:MAG: tryptophan 2,3-dioxygenase [Acidobacteria bacterium]|nr:tryptophan 2,3-dioxygenase [Acidobacteriota bacterium]